MKDNKYISILADIKQRIQDAQIKDVSYSQQPNAFVVLAIRKYNFR